MKEMTNNPIGKIFNLFHSDRIAIALLGLHLSDRLSSPICTPEDGEPTKVTMPEFLKYDVILFITSHHLLWREHTPHRMHYIYISTYNYVHNKCSSNRLFCKIKLT